MLLKMCNLVCMLSKLTLTTILCKPWNFYHFVFLKLIPCLFKIQLEAKERYVLLVIQEFRLMEGLHLECMSHKTTLDIDIQPTHTEK